MNRRNFFASLAGVGLGTQKVEPPKPKVVPIELQLLDGKTLARLVIPHLYALTRSEGVRLTTDR